MPFGDGTGPLGLGPQTGRGLGPCDQGYARGFGRGYGRRWVWQQQTAKETEQEDETTVKTLKAQLQALEEGIAAIKQQLDALTKKEA